jgi:hypothetical protein
MCSSARKRPSGRRESTRLDGKRPHKERPWTVRKKLPTMHAGGAHASDATSRCGQRLATVALYDLRGLLFLEGGGDVLAVMVVVVDPSRHERGQAGARSACAWRDVACGGRLRRSGSRCRACGSKSTLVAVHRIEFCARGMPGTPWMRDGRVDWVQTIEPPPPPPPSWTMHGHPARPGRQCCVVRLCAVVTLKERARP